MKSVCLFLVTLCVGTAVEASDKQVKTRPNRATVSVPVEVEVKPMKSQYARLTKRVDALETKVDKALAGIAMTNEKLDRLIERLAPAVTSAGKAKKAKDEGYVWVRSEYGEHACYRGSDGLYFAYDGQWFKAVTPYQNVFCIIRGNTYCKVAPVDKTFQVLEEVGL